MREGADAIMLSGETAYGRYPYKAVDVQSTVAVRTELSMSRYKVRHRGVWLCRGGARSCACAAPLRPG